METLWYSLLSFQIKQKSENIDIVVLCCGIFGLLDSTNTKTQQK